MVSVSTSPWWVGSTCLRGSLGTWCGKGCAAGCAWCPKGGALGGQSTQAVRASLSINMWPLQKTAHVVTNQMATEVFMRRERRRLQARHIWEKIEPDWPMIRARVWTKQATGLPYDALHRRLFLHDYTEESRWLENSYRGPHWRWVQQQWKNCQAWFAGQAVARSPSQWISTLYLHGLDQLDALSWQWLNQHENIVEQVWHTQQGTFRRKRPPDVRDDPMRGQ